MKILELTEKEIDLLSLWDSLCYPFKMKVLKEEHKEVLESLHKKIMHLQDEVAIDKVYRASEDELSHLENKTMD